MKYEAAAMLSYLLIKFEENINDTNVDGFVSVFLENCLMHTHNCHAYIKSRLGLLSISIHVTNEQITQLKQNQLCENIINALILEYKRASTEIIK